MNHGLLISLATAVGSMALARMLISKTTGFTALLPGLRGLLRPVGAFGSIALVQYEGTKGDVYNILWVLVFGFATLNILGLVGRRFEPDRTRLNVGELLAVLVVFLSIGLLGWEMLGLLHIFPIQLKPH